MAVKPRPSPRLTIFDEEVDPEEELFGPARMLSPQGCALRKDVPSRDRK